jgi:hypothetical protein
MSGSVRRYGDRSLIAEAGSSAKRRATDRAADGTSGARRAAKEIGGVVFSATGSRIQRRYCAVNAVTVAENARPGDPGAIPAPKRRMSVMSVKTA